MRKIIYSLATLLCLAWTSSCGAVEPATATTTVENPNWEISMMPKETEEEKEQNRWSIVLENTTGIYAYDMASLNYSEGVNGVPDKNYISVEVKTVFTNKDLLKNLNAKYAGKLAKKEKVQYCLLFMTFNLPEKTYVVRHMEVYGSKKTLLETRDKERNLVTIPAGSFAEAMYEICQKAVNEQEGAAAKQEQPGQEEPAPEENKVEE